MVLLKAEASRGFAERRISEELSSSIRVMLRNKSTRNQILGNPLGFLEVVVLLTGRKA
jgi:hypothetical protein